MTTNQQIKAPCTQRSFTQLDALQGACRASADAPESAPATPPVLQQYRGDDACRRCTFTTANKRRILKEVDQCARPGELGALMRRECVYSSALSTWRRQFEAADLDALAPQKRGPRADLTRLDALQIAQLTRERDKLRIELDKANLMIDLRSLYGAILDQGDLANPLRAPSGKRGGTKQSVGANLLRRLRLYGDDVWRFMTDPAVPFTNNLAEQAVRMPKVKQKVSGCFRTSAGAQTFCVIRSYLAIMHKQGPMCSIASQEAPDN